ncbi:MAG: hypothetical protein NVS3B20_05690 [Polyangiales bacterium]
MDPGVPMQVDPLRLPRLKFVATQAAEAGETLIDPSQSHPVEIGDDRIARIDGRALSLKPLPIPEGQILSATLSRDGLRLIVVSISEAESGRLGQFNWGEGVIRLFDTKTQSLLGRFQGHEMRELDDGRFAIRRQGGLELLDHHFHKTKFIPGGRADISPDGTRLLHLEASKGNEMYHPVAPWIRNLSDGTEWELGPLLEPSQVSPASVVWPRIAPVRPTGCADLGVMPGAEPQCVHPAIVVGTEQFGSNDDVACVPAHPRSREKFACLDPRGSVKTTDPWDPALVCRIGPHVLPLAVCAELFSIDSPNESAVESEGE